MAPVRICDTQPIASKAMTQPRTQTSFLPDDAPLRATLHNEVHARPAARIRLPALIVYVAVLNAGISREQECAHLRLLPNQQDLPLENLANNFLRLRLGNYTLKWERHTEFTRYSIVQALPAHANLGALPGTDEPDLSSHLVVSADWLRSLPGQTVAAIQMAMVEADISDTALTLQHAQNWFGGRTVLVSLLGMGHSWAVSELRIGEDGFERMLVIAPPGTSESRSGRNSHRLLEMETYRLMALRGLPVAKELGTMLSECEGALADITMQLDQKSASDQNLLDCLVSLAARVERATAAHGYRFSATRAYAALVAQRIAELSEKEIPGTQSIGNYLQHRLSPAIATVAATEQRLNALSERIARASALLRTRVDIATEVQNQQLLEKLTRGQELQLSLQSTVEGLSIAAVSYYVVNLLLYAGKTLKALGLPTNPEIIAGSMIPIVLWAVWRGTRYIRSKFHLGK
jgi:uncharacterized membrane-anchored protein